MDNKMLKSRAVQNPLTPNPSINLSASKMIHALITSKNNPNVTIVMGMVRITKMGFKMAFNNAKTTATMMAAVKPLTATPGKKCANNTTIPAVISSLMIRFIMIRVLVKRLRYEIYNSLIKIFRIFGM